LLQDAVVVYRAYREQIEHEDDLIGLRIGWFIAAEALLFATYGVVLAVQQAGAIRGTVPIDHRVFTMVPILGMTMAVLVGAGVAAAMHHIALLWLRYDREPRPCSRSHATGTHACVLGIPLERRSRSLVDNRKCRSSRNQLLLFS